MKATIKGRMIGLAALAGMLFSAPAGAQLAGHGGAVKGLDVSPDGRWVMSASFDYTAMLWDLDAQKELATFDAHEGAVNGVAILPNGDQAVSASDDGMLRLWDLESGALLHAFTGHEGKVAGVAVSPDGKLAASAGWDRTARIWDLETRRLLTTLKGHTDNVNAVAFSPDGSFLIPFAATSSASMPSPSCRTAGARSRSAATRPCGSGISKPARTSR